MKKYLAVSMGITILGLAMSAGAAPTPVDFGTYGIGYLVPPLAQPEEELGNMITVFNTGVSANNYLGSGENYIIDKGSATPSSLSAPLTDLSGSSVSYTDITVPFTVPAGATYLAVKWDGNNGGGAYYDVSSLDGDSILLSESDVSVFGNKTLEPSGYEFWSANSSAVPDGTSTVMVLGATLTGLGLIRRKIAGK